MKMRTTVKREHRKPAAPVRKRRGRQVPRVFAEVKKPVGARREAARVALESRLKEAREQQIYWTEKHLMAERVPERAILGARAMAWAMTVRAILDKLAIQHGRAAA